MTFGRSLFTNGSATLELATNGKTLLHVFIDDNEPTERLAVMSTIHGKAWPWA